MGELADYHTERGLDAMSMDDDGPEPEEAPGETVEEWIAKAEAHYGRFLDPAKYGAPRPNPGNGMHARDAKAWASYTPEQKRAAARMNLYPPVGTRTGKE